MSKKVFEGIKVAEFAWVVVGPSTSRYLADHGATVVKIESHKRLDTNRINGPFVGGVPTPDGSMFYGKHNPNKYCISIDLTSPGGKKLAKKMIEWADVVTESFSPGTMEKWGLGYEEAKKINPDVIYFSSSMQGRGGPHTAYAGYGQNAVNFSGFTEVSGWPDRLPLHLTGPIRLCELPVCSFRHYGCPGLPPPHREGPVHRAVPVRVFCRVPGSADYGLPDQRKRSWAATETVWLLPHTHGVFQCQGDDRWVAIAVMDQDQWDQILPGNRESGTGNP
jgi:benzylsuccinate CoA-transferase BbsF subunit